MKRAAERTRTFDSLITNEVLYQLSYSGTWSIKYVLSRTMPRDPAIERSILRCVFPLFGLPAMRHFAGR